MHSDIAGILLKKSLFIIYYIKVILFIKYIYFSSNKKEKVKK